MILLGLVKEQKKLSRRIKNGIQEKLPKQQIKRERDRVTIFYVLELNKQPIGIAPQRIKYSNKNAMDEIHR